MSVVLLLNVLEIVPVFDKKEDKKAVWVTAIKKIGLCSIYNIQSLK